MQRFEFAAALTVHDECAARCRAPSSLPRRDDGGRAIVAEASKRPDIDHRCCSWGVFASMF